MYRSVCYVKIFLYVQILGCENGNPLKATICGSHYTELLCLHDFSFVSTILPLHNILISQKLYRKAQSEKNCTTVPEITIRLRCSVLAIRWLLGLLCASATGFKTQGQRQPKSETERTSCPIKWILVQRSLLNMRNFYQCKDDVCHFLHYSELIPSISY